MWDIEDVGTRRRFCARTSRRISGEVLYVDGGYRTVGIELPADGDGPEKGVKPNYGQDAVSTETGSTLGKTL